MLTTTNRNVFIPKATFLTVNRLAGKGDTYQTNIYRKRQLKDPNEPSLVYMETLKWTTIRMLRDVRRRHVFKRYYLNRSCLKNIQKCRMLPNSIRETAKEEHSINLPRDSRFHHLRNRCAISGRSRGIVKKYRLSRLVWRNLADYNKLSDVIHLRKDYRIVGNLVGSLPEFPRQPTDFGLPLILMNEEIRLLDKLGIVSIVTISSDSYLQCFLSDECRSHYDRLKSEQYDEINQRFKEARKLGIEDKFEKICEGN
ncbi:hypothetical protein RDWZM_002141 [Blomia tropicalis]|uniref:TSEN34 N-terminal domain-containing protein n=1 Tax=Blomia tropicalis TaxID=40697 RepID=A0A9Q0RRB7_BLOTA|nr:hypothetical protein RDWZM_002141 [Blomia tropicalis]